MAKKLFKNLLLSVLLCIVFSDLIHTDDADYSCISQTPCLCQLDDQRHIDISGVVTKDEEYLSVTDGNLTYFFFPCHDVLFNYTKYKLSVNATLDACKEGTSICLYNAAEHSLTNLGKTEGVQFSNGIPKLLVYSKPKISTTTTIKLDCTPDDSTSYLEVNKKLKDQPELVLFSSHVCIRTEHHGLSTGSTLLVLFCVGFGIYFIIGAVVLHFLRGARGKEMIPNLDFWVDLPCLVRDGIVFLMNGCNPLSISTPETYDRI